MRAGTSSGVVDTAVVALYRAYRLRRCMCLTVRSAIAIPIKSKQGVCRWGLSWSDQRHRSMSSSVIPTALFSLRHVYNMSYKLSSCCRYCYDDGAAINKVSPGVIWWTFDKPIINRYTIHSVVLWFHFLLSSVQIPGWVSNCTWTDVLCCLTPC